MNKEEIEAYKKCKEFVYIKMSPLAEAVDILLNLIEKQQAELDKKDRIIDYMALTLDQTSALRNGIGCRIKKEECNQHGCQKCIKEYFEKKVEIPEEK